MTKIVCPNCAKDINITVDYGQTQTSPEKPFIESKASDTLRSTPKPEGMVTTEQAKKLKSKVNIEGLISDKSGIRTLNKKDGTQTNVCDCSLTDDVGKIKLTLWGDETNLVNNGNKIRITNGYTNVFKGDVSLTKGKFGKLEILS